ncbi:MAG: four helix bundle protein [Polyangiaceae bacterium]|nr:four helix bundle protein [Polyangiaceae bacterium]
MGHRPVSPSCLRVSPVAHAPRPSGGAGSGSNLRAEIGATGRSRILRVVGHDPKARRQDLVSPLSPSRSRRVRGSARRAREDDALAKKLPRGYGPLSDQLRRASQSAFLQLAEGAARSGADRAQRLRGARAEACEAAACVEALGRLGLSTQSEVAELLSLLGRLAAMLTKLAGR